MNKIWSEKIQGIQTLYLSRKLTFDDVFAKEYKALFGITEKYGIKILEIGCGPGAFAGALHRWYPKADITGIDRDTNFIKFAKENESGIEFTEADATHLPFDCCTFDVTVSHTVCEHIEPGAFWGEQFRVLKRGGRCICLSSRMERKSCVKAPCLAETEEEHRFWAEVTEDNDDFEKYGVGKYYAGEDELALQPARCGFSDVTVGHITLELAPDDTRYPAEFSERIIEAQRQADIEAVSSTGAEAAGRIIEIINKKYDERMRLLHAGVKQNDTSVSVISVIVCRKP